LRTPLVASGAKLVGERCHQRSINTQDQGGFDMGILDIWPAIIVASVLVWVLSALIWTVFGWHNSDFANTDNEKTVRAALKGLSPGLYNVPHCASQKDMATPEMQQLMREGPIALITVLPSGVAKMGGKLLSSFFYNVFVSVLCAYLVTRTLPVDASYLQVFRVAGAVAFTAYGIAYIQEYVWFGRPLGLTVKNLLDAFLYGLVTGGAFGWLA
jgi:hypothetical protein